MFQEPIYHFHPLQAPPLPPRPPPPWLQESWFSQSPSNNSIWNAETLQDHLKDTREMLDILKAMKKELEAIQVLKDSGDSFDEGDNDSIIQLSKGIRKKMVSLGEQELLSLEAAKSLYLKIKDQFAPLNVVTSQVVSWEEKSEVMSLAQKLQKHKRNKQWKKKKRRRVGEMLHKERELYDKIDQEADEWRTREIAKDIGKRKVGKMKEIARVKANEERRRLESELELVLVVEKLQELRAIRIQKLKKQGHFIPGEDDKFLDRVQAAVEEEERQAAAAAETDAAKGAIASAEESRKAIQNIGNYPKDVKAYCSDADTSNLQLNLARNEENFREAEHQEPEQESNGQGVRGTYEYLSNLPLEFYHYYHGSNYDMGTLIEVRRVWDAYIRPGGSRIPGHWIQPPPPSNEIWASYLVTSKK